MKKILILIALSMLRMSASYGSDPVQSFVYDLTQARDANTWFIEDDGVPNPKGGYIYRFEWDLDGDGQKEVFVASSLDAEKKGESWSVYRKNGHGNYMKIKNSYFMGGGLRVKIENGMRKYLFYVPLKPAEGGSYFGYFWLDAGGNWHSETHRLAEPEQAMMDGSDASVLGQTGLPDDTTVAQKLALGEVVKRDIQKVLLAKYTQNARTAWRTVNRKFALSQQYLDPADTADIASVANWQP